MRRYKLYLLVAGVVGAILGLDYITSTPPHVRKVIDNVNLTGKPIEYDYKGQRFQAHSRKFADGLEIIIFSSMGKKHVAVLNTYLHLQHDEIIDKAPLTKLNADGEIDDFPWWPYAIPMETNRRTSQLSYETAMILANDIIQGEELEKVLRESTYPSK